MGNRTRSGRRRRASGGGGGSASGSKRPRWVAEEELEEEAGPGDGEDEDLCFVCKDGGELRICDYRFARPRCSLPSLSRFVIPRAARRGEGEVVLVGDYGASGTEARDRVRVGRAVGG